MYCTTPSLWPSLALHPKEARFIFFLEGEIIKSIKKIIGIVFPNLPTNKMLLFIQMWYNLVIFYFLFFVLIRKLTHTFA